MNFFNDENDAIMSVLSNAYVAAYTKSKEKEAKKKKNQELSKLVQEQVSTWLTTPSKPKQTYLSPLPPEEEQAPKTFAEQKQAELYFTDPKEFKKLYGEVTYEKYREKPEIIVKEREAIEAAKTPEEKEKSKLYWSDPEKYQELYGEAPDKEEGIGISFPPYQVTAEQFGQEAREAVPKKFAESADVIRSTLGTVALQIPKTAMTGVLALLEQDQTLSMRLFDIEAPKAEGEGLVGKVNKAIDFLEEAQQKEMEGVEEEWQKNLFALTSGATSVAAAVGIAVLTKSPSAATAFLSSLESSDTYLEARDAGKTPEEALGLAGASFAGTYMLERAGLEFLLGSGTLVSKFLTEAGQETVQQFFQDTVSNIGYEKAYSPFDEYLRTAWTSGVVGGGVGLVLTFTEGTPEAKLSNDLQEMGMEQGQAETFVKAFSLYSSAMQHQLLNGMRESFSFKEARMAHLKGMEKGTPGIDYPTEPPQRQLVVPDSAPKIPEGFYDVEVPTPVQVAKQKLAETGTSAKLMLDQLFTPISTRLKNINPVLKTRFRRFEFDTVTNAKAKLDRVSPVLEGMKKMEKQDRAVLDLAFKNRDKAKAAEIAKKYGMESQIEDMRATLNDIYDELKNVGYEFGYLKDYIPRIVKDHKGLLEHFGKDPALRSHIGDAIADKEREVGRALSVEEKSAFVNTLIRGFGKDKIMLSQSSSMKGRAIDFVDPEVNRFYESSESAIVKYIARASELIEARKFFGKALQADANVVDIDESVGAYTLDLLAKGEITPNQEVELANILRARFSSGKMNVALGVYKNLSYIDTMGSVISAVTQLGDLAFAAYKSGAFNAAAGFTKAVFKKAKVTREDIGIEHIAQEFAEPSLSARAVNQVFKFTGLNALDAVGKETLINSSLRDYTAQANSKKPSKEFLKTLEENFETEAERRAVVRDLKKGKISSDVKFMLFNSLLDIQPVMKSEMPEVYLKAPNSRIFYMLKTYTIKTVDIWRREVFEQMKTDPAGATKNMIRLASYMMLMNGTADFLKDLILGRKFDLKDTTIDNMFRLFGFSKFIIYEARMEGFGTAVMELILPPAKFTDALIKDGRKIYETIDSYDVTWEDFKSETVASIPIGGKLYYWWFGRGRQKIEDDMIGGSFDLKEFKSDFEKRVFTQDEKDYINALLIKASEEGLMTDEERKKYVKSFKSGQEKAKESLDLIEKIKEKDYSQEEALERLTNMNELSTSHEKYITKKQLDFIMTEAF